jgi:hypothetical protein
MFSDRFGIPQLADILVPREDYRPFPIADSRPEWQALSADLRQARIAAGEKYSGWQWPALPATRYMDYSRDGDRSRYETPYHARRNALADLVVAECVEGAGRFIDDIINGIWHICEETSWVVPAHNQWDGARDPLPDAAKPAIDLFAGGTAGLLAWTHHLLRRSRARETGVGAVLCRSKMGGARRVSMRGDLSPGALKSYKRLSARL